MDKESMAAFLGTCGLAGPLDVQVEDTRTGRSTRWLFHQPFLLLGRGSQADLPLEAEDVSRRHAYLQAIGGRLFAIDLQSRTGIHTAKGPRRACWLVRSQPISIGPYLLWAGPEDHDGATRPANPLTACRPEEELPPDVSLEMSVGDNPPCWWRMDRLLALFGSSPSCKLRLVAPYVSAFCGSLVRTPTGLWLVDLLGQPGTHVNGNQARWMRLSEGDRVEIAGTAVTVHYATVAAPQRTLTGRLVPAPHEPVPLPTSTALAPVATHSPLAETQLAPLQPTTTLFGPPASALRPRTQDPLVALLLALGEQTASQQQMFQQFTQTILMMGQTLAQANHDQRALFAKELKRIHRSTRDLEMLQQQLAQQVSAPAGLACAPAAAAKKPSTPDPLARAAERLPSPLSPVGNGAVLPPAPSAPVATKPGQPTQDIHALLSQRIAELQQERQSGWTALLGLFGGSRAATPPG
jgi:pSer/pThr/pTyr-binding forkhead associated (FHA) protein